MRRSGLNEGTRAEILAELDQYGSDRLDAGKHDRAREYAKAINAIENGADEVRVEHAVYRVTDSPGDGEDPALMLGSAAHLAE